MMAVMMPAKPASEPEVKTHDGPRRDINRGCRDIHWSRLNIHRLRVDDGRSGLHNHLGRLDINRLWCSNNGRRIIRGRRVGISRDGLK